MADTESTMVRVYLDAKAALEEAVRGIRPENRTHILSNLILWFAELPEPDRKLIASGVGPRTLEELRKIRDAPRPSASEEDAHPPSTDRRDGIDQPSRPGKAVVPASRGSEIEDDHGGASGREQSSKVRKDTGPSGGTGRKETASNKR